MKKIAFWASTALLSFALLGSAAANLTQAAPIVESMKHLGYPPVVSKILGVWKLLGALAILAPGFVRLKEWAYAGCFFCFTGAMASHLAAGDGFGGIVAPLVLLGLMSLSWATRDHSRGGPFVSSED